MNREDVTVTEKNKLANELMVKEAKRIAESKQKLQVEKYVDNVKLGVDGWKMRYYTNKSVSLFRK